MSYNSSEMKKILFIFSTTDGHTHKITQSIAAGFEDECDINLKNVDDTTAEDLNLHHHIVIGASIRYGNHQPKLMKFIKDNRDILVTKNAAFFSVNAVARKTEKNRPNTNPYVQKFIKKTGWSPEEVDVFAGVIDYPKYHFIDKHMIKFIMWITGGPTDTNGTFEFTDWQRVKEFTKKLKASFSNE